MKKPLNISPRPKHDPARNTPWNVGLKTDKPEVVDVNGEEGSVSHKQPALRYFEGKSKAGKAKPFFPGDVGAVEGPGGGDPGKGDYPPSAGQPGNDLNEFVDRSTKTPYGGNSMGWSAKSGKLGDLDPQEKDQPGWVNTWGECVEGMGQGLNMTLDENYYVQRPRTKSRQQEAFNEYNPEFQDVSDRGDWTSYSWTKDV